MGQYFIVEVEETFRKKVAIYAEDAQEAHETAEEACNKDIIDATRGFDGFERNISVLDAVSEKETAGYLKIIGTESAVTAIKGR